MLDVADTLRASTALSRVLRSNSGSARQILMTELGAVDSEDRGELFYVRRGWNRNRLPHT